MIFNFAAPSRGVVDASEATPHQAAGSHRPSATAGRRQPLAPPRRATHPNRQRNVQDGGGGGGGEEACSLSFVAAVPTSSVVQGAKSSLAPATLVTAPVVAMEATVWLTCAG